MSLILFCLLFGCSCRHAVELHFFGVEPTWRQIKPYWRYSGAALAPGLVIFRIGGKNLFVFCFCCVVFCESVGLVSLFRMLYIIFLHAVFTSCIIFNGFLQLHMLVMNYVQNVICCQFSCIEAPLPSRAHY